LAGELRLKIVFLVRHAKSSWKDTSLPDRDRPLKKRGVNDLWLLKPVLTGKDCKPEHIFSSDAVRAAETAKTLAGFYGLKKKNVTLSDELYGSSPGEILAFIRDREDILHRIMIVGHNPGLSETANLLGARPLEAAMPTSAVACFSFDVERWRQLRENGGLVEFYIYPREYKREAPRSTGT